MTILSAHTVHFFSIRDSDKVLFKLTVVQTLILLSLFHTLIYVLNTGL